MAERVRPSMKLSQLHMVIEALEYVAHSEAAHSQAPNLFHECDTDEGAFAQVLRKRYTQQVSTAAVIDNPQAELPY